MRMVGLDRQPCMSIAREQAIGGGRAAGPGIEQPLHGAPSCLDRIGALKQDRIADEAVVDQRLVSDRCEWREIVLVGEIHLDAFDFDLCAWTLGAETER